MSSFTENNNTLSEMQQNLMLLQEVGLFATFPLQSLKLLALVAERLNFRKGDTIFEVGDDFGQSFLVLSGQLNLQTVIEGENRIVKEYFDGDFLGSFSLLGPLPSLYSLTAAADSILLTLSRRQMQKILEEFPQTQMLALEYMADEIHRWERNRLNSVREACLSHIGVTIL